MCGIAGIIDFAGRPIVRDRLVRACEMLHHRGPDDLGCWSERRGGFGVGLAATRLAILDPTPAGHQPMLRDDGRFALVFNGLIYNYRDIRDELASTGEVFQTSSDTEVALSACVRWGPEALRRFNGMFALAFVDLEAGQGFLARDRFGVKPLFWSNTGGRLTFASEMNTLCVLDDSTMEVDPEALVHYVTYGYFSHPDTVLRGVHRLPPATCLSFHSSGLSTPSTFSTIPLRVDDSVAEDTGVLARRVRRAIFESVARRRVADVPIGAFLSGGIDSSIVVAHLAELSGEPVRTFSVGWKDQSEYDETAYAKIVADRFGTDHHELRCGFDDVIGLLPDILDHCGEPFFDSSLLPTAIVSAFARRYVTVCLSGDGADELFGGYWRYLAHSMYRTYERLPSWLRVGIIERLAEHASSGKATPFQNRVRQLNKLLRVRSGDPVVRHAAWSSILSPDARGILRGDSCEDRMATAIRCVRGTQSPVDELNRIMAFDLQSSLPCDMLHKVDLASMRHSLEVRVPFLDPSVVDLARRIPSALKLGREGGKLILRRAYRGLLPDEVLSRSKRGFEVPMGEFLRRELRELFLDTVDRPTIDSFGLLDFDAIVKVYDDHCAHRGEHADVLFALLSLCRWQQQRRVNRQG